jgi:hypothetical protein
MWYVLLEKCTLVSWRLTDTRSSDPACVQDMEWLNATQHTEAAMWNHKKWAAGLETANAATSQSHWPLRVVVLFQSYVSSAATTEGEKKTNSKSPEILHLGLV